MGTGKYFLAALSFLMLLTGTAQARPEFRETFLKFYAVKKGEPLEKIECQLCHGTQGFQVRNPYGRALRELVKKGKGVLTTDMLITAEGKDSDGDGYTNLEEIVSGTLPGDPASHPKSHPTNLPVHQVSKSFSMLYPGIAVGVAILVALFVGLRKRKSPSTM